MSHPFIYIYSKARPVFPPNEIVLKTVTCFLMTKFIYTYSIPVCMDTFHKTVMARVNGHQHHKASKVILHFHKKNKDIYISHTHSWSQNFTHTFQNLLNVNYFTKIRGIIQIACYFLFSTDLNKIYKNTGKPENLWDLRVFSEEQQTV